MAFLRTRLVPTVALCLSLAASISWSGVEQSTPGSSQQPTGKIGQDPPQKKAADPVGKAAASRPTPESCDRPGRG